MLGRLILVLMLGGVAVVHAQDPQASRLTCELIASEETGKILFEGLVAGEAETAGRYTLEITKTGPAGSVTSRQGGSFLAKPPVSTVLGRIAITLEDGAGYKAVLMVDAEGRSYVCEKTGSAAQR
jgi:hypothetical protein